MNDTYRNSQFPDTPLAHRMCVWTLNHNNSTNPNIVAAVSIYFRTLDWSNLQPQVWDQIQTNRESLQGNQAPISD